MWLPIREILEPARSYSGYSELIQPPHTRFPSLGYNIDVMPAYVSRFEALDTVRSTDEDSNPQTFDFAKAKSTFGLFNACQHYKREVTINPGSISYDTDYRNNGIPLRRLWDYNFFGLPAHPAAFFGAADFNHLSALYHGPIDGVYRDHNHLVDAALASMLPGIRPKTSLINSIYELKDYKTIPRTLTAIEASVAQLSNKFSKKLWNKFTLQQIVKGPADVNLQFKFNIMPLLQDITNVSFSVGVVNSKLKQLTANSKRPIRAHWGANLSQLRDSNDSITMNSGASSSAQVTLRQTVTYLVKRFQATLEYHYEIPNYSEREGLLRGLADYNGVVLSPQVIWNAIPFSFVVDWVAGVGPWLSQFTPRQLEVVTHITKFGWSVKVVREIDYYMEPFGRVSHCREQSYFRTPDRAPLVSSLKTSGLNQEEFNLATSLAIGLSK